MTDETYSMRADKGIPARAMARRCVFALTAGSFAFAGAAAHAQEAEGPPQTLDPSGDQPVERGAPPDPYRPESREPAARRGQTARPPAEGSQEGEEGEDAEAAEESGYYHYDGILGTPRNRGPGGGQPARHEVRRGDTLWDITALYRNDPFEWPQVWSLNPHITNPHWIYPGDEVRLRDDEEAEPNPSAEPDDSSMDIAGAPPSEGEPSGPLTTSFRLRQTAFVDQADLAVAAEVDGAPSERELLVEGDTLYIDDVGAAELRRGETYAIYAEKQDVKHPDSGEVVGAYVKLLGELEIESLGEGERAVAEITSSVDVVERGSRVGPLVRRFAEVESTPPSTDLQGTIVATVEIGELVGQNHLVVVDRGARAGVEVGNPLYVTRRGDGFAPKMGGTSQVGQDDESYPPRIVGEIRVVEVSEGTALGWVTTSALEVGVGDRVIMRSDSE